MPVRRDFTGYTYEVEDWEGSSFSGVLWKPLSPSCMIENKARWRRWRLKKWEEERKR